MLVPLALPLFVLAEGALPEAIGGKARFGPSLFSPDDLLATIGIGAVTGPITGRTGAGGGFTTFSIFVYLLGNPTAVIAGTNSPQAIFTAVYGGIFEYAVHGYVFRTLAMGMLLGSLVGVQLGALATACVSPMYIRAFYAVAILAGFVNQLSSLSESLAKLGIVDLDPSVTCRRTSSCSAGCWSSTSPTRSGTAPECCCCSTTSDWARQEAEWRRPSARGREDQAGAESDLAPRFLPRGRGNRRRAASAPARGRGTSSTSMEPARWPGLG